MAEHTFRSLLAQEVQNFVTSDLELLAYLDVDEGSEWEAFTDGPERTIVTVTRPSGKRESFKVEVTPTRLRGKGFGVVGERLDPPSRWAPDRPQRVRRFG